MASFEFVRASLYQRVTLMQRGDMCRVKIKFNGLVSYAARATTYFSSKLFVTFLFV